MSKQFQAVDIFSGGGGLTVGLKAAGVSVVSAVELDSHAYATYTANHPEVRAFKQDVKTILGDRLKEHSHENQIDILAGCPPCQGFSSLTRKYKKQDPRNELICEMGRLVSEIRPRAIMMENVPGLAQRGKPLLDQFLQNIEAMGYKTNYGVLQVADYGVPQFRRRFVLVAGLGFEIKLPSPTHSQNGLNGLPQWISVQDAIGGMPEPQELSHIKERGGPQAFNWHVVRTLSPENRARLRHALPGRSWQDIPEKIRPDCHKGGYKGFSNVYGRMTWSDVSPTITGGCTTLSKGRFGHPERDRTISVREAALLQTFPANYIFDTPYMEHVCNIVGNALPCKFAEAIARECVGQLQIH